MDYMRNPCSPTATPSWIVTPDPALQINCVALTLDGAHILGGSDDGSVYCWGQTGA